MGLRGENPGRKGGGKSQEEGEGVFTQSNVDLQKFNCFLMPMLPIILFQYSGKINK